MTQKQPSVVIVNEETIREATWELCKEYDRSLHRREEVRLRNFVSSKLEDVFGTLVENVFREEWQEEVCRFSVKYGYAPIAVRQDDLQTL
jgi:hypothetical protein